MCRLLLQAIGLHAVEGEQQEYQSFRTTINQLLTKASDKASAAEGLVAVSAATKAMHDYGDRTSRYIQAQHLELQALSRMLTEAITDLAPTAAHARELHEIDWSISKAASLEDIKDLRKRIADCLETIRSEITEEQKNAKRAPRVLEPDPELEKELDDRADAIQHLPLTELPVRSEGEAAIRKIRHNGGRSFVAIFVVDRLRYVNTRFGNEIGNQITALFQQHLASEISPGDRLFRWDESSFLVLFEKRESEDQLRREIEQILLKRLVETFTVNDRSITLTISARWTMVPIAEVSCDAMLNKLDLFVAQNTR